MLESPAPQRTSRMLATLGRNRTVASCVTSVDTLPPPLSRAALRVGQTRPSRHRWREGCTPDAQVEARPIWGSSRTVALPEGGCSQLSMTTVAETADLFNLGPPIVVNLHCIPTAVEMQAKLDTVNNVGVRSSPPPPAVALVLADPPHRCHPDTFAALVHHRPHQRQCYRRCHHGTIVCAATRRLWC